MSNGVLCRAYCHFVFCLKSWKAIISDQGASCYLDSHKKWEFFSVFRSSYLIFTVHSCLEVSMVLYNSCHFIGPVQSSPHDLSLGEEKMNSILCVHEQMWWQTAAGDCDIPGLSLLDLTLLIEPSGHLPTMWTWPRTSRLLPQSSDFHISPGLKGKASPQGWAAYSSVIY